MYALSKALIAFRFCTRIGPTEAQVLPCAPARNDVSIPSYRGVEVRRPEALRASVSRKIPSATSGSNKGVKIVPKALSGAIARHSGDGKFYAMPHNEALVGG